MAIVMPGEDRLPAGPRRDLVAAFHALYSDAGRPGTRTMAKAISKDNTLPTTVSHETLAGLLHGRAIPEWPRLHSAVRHLVGSSFRQPPPDPDASVARFHTLWLAERDTPRPTMAPEPTPSTEPSGLAAPASSRALRIDVSAAEFERQTGFLLPKPPVPAPSPEEAPRLPARTPASQQGMPYTPVGRPAHTRPEEPMLLAERAVEADRACGAVVPLLPMGVGLDSVWSVAFSPHGSHLAAAGHDKIVWMWDTVLRRPVGDPLVGHTDYVYSVAFSPDGRLLASAGDDHMVRLWDAAARTPVGHPLTGHTGVVWSVAFSPDGGLLASVSSDRTARLWDTATRSPVGDPLTGHTHDVNAVAFSPHGHVFVTASRDRTARLWDTATRSPLGGPLTGHSGDVRAVAFSPDGSLLITSAGSLLRWSMPPVRARS